MGLIKAQVAPQLVRFQWRDVQAEANRVLADAQCRAEAIIAQAQAAAEATRDAAQRDGHEEGYRKGVEEGREQAHRQSLDLCGNDLQTAIATLDKAATEAALFKEQIKAGAIEELVELAIAIARRVTKQQAMIDPHVLVANLRDALAMTSRQRHLRIAIHPSQRQVLASAIPQLEMEWPAIGAAQIVDDASLCPGGCRVFTEHGQIDADLNAQLDRIVAGLLPHRDEEAA